MIAPTLRVASFERLERDGSDPVAVAVAITVAIAVLVLVFIRRQPARPVPRPSIEEGC